jgi:hypothetical protein
MQKLYSRTEVRFAVFAVAGLAFVHGPTLGRDRQA